MYPGNPWAPSEQAKISRKEIKGKRVTAPKGAPGDRGNEAAAEGLGSLGPLWTVSWGDWVEGQTHTRWVGWGRASSTPDGGQRTDPSL